MCTILRPPGVNTIAVNKYIISISDYKLSLYTQKLKIFYKICNKQAYQKLSSSRMRSLAFRGQGSQLKGNGYFCLEDRRRFSLQVPSDTVPVLWTTRPHTHAEEFISFSHISDSWQSAAFIYCLNAFYQSQPWTHLKKKIRWAGWLSRYSDSLRAGWSGNRIPVQPRFSASFQTDPGAHPASCTMGTGSFPGANRPGRGVDQPPPSSAEVKVRVELYLYSPSGPTWLFLGWTLLLPLPSAKISDE